MKRPAPHPILANIVIDGYLVIDQLFNARCPLTTKDLAQAEAVRLGNQDHVNTYRVVRGATVILD